MKVIKDIIKKIFYRKNKFYTILMGPLKGFKIYLSDNSQYAPIIGNWEPEAQKIFKKLIKPNDVVFDLGANIGIHTLLFSKLVSNSGKVVSFEPLEVNFKELNINLECNNITNTKTENIAISNINGISRFMIGNHNTQGSLVGIGNNNDEVIDVKTETLDFYIKEKKLYPNFIKVDVEGAEYGVLEGFEKEIDQCNPTFYIESHSIENESYILSFFKSRNYNLYVQQLDTTSNKNEIPYCILVTKDANRLFNNSKGNGTVVAIHLSRIQNILK